MNDCGQRIDLTIPGGREYALVASMALSAMGVLAGLDVELLGDLQTVASECLDCLNHQAGCRLCLQMTQVQPVEADIAVTSNGGYPLDQNVYQSVKGMTAAEACVRPGGAILMCAALSDGHGGEDFYRWFADRPDAKTVMEDIRNVPPESTHMDQWEAQVLARVMLKANCWMITGPENRHLVENMHLRWAPDVDTALRQAGDLLGGNASVTVIPDGVGVIVRK